MVKTKGQRDWENSHSVPARILIADDSELMRSRLKQLLESHSIHWKVCAEAANGLHAVQKAMRAKPDLIILDLAMPIMDGLTASAEIARLLPHIPILIHTLHKAAYTDSEANKAGVRGVISKSDPGELLRVVKILLEESWKRPCRRVNGASA